MTTRKKSISRLSVLALGASFVGLPATAALAAEPTTAPEAQAMAQQYREQADHYRALGGVGYKTGLVQRAEADAATHSALAERLGAPVATPVRSPDAERYAELAARYRAMGGIAYKAGLVQWAEAQQQKYEVAPVTAAPEQSKPSCPFIKPAVMVACRR
jgi:hypothetical protein